MESFALILLVILSLCCCNICCFKSSNSFWSNNPSPFWSYCIIIFCASAADILHAFANSMADNFPSPLASIVCMVSFAFILFVILFLCCSNICCFNSSNSCWSNNPSPFASYCIIIFCASWNEILQACANSFADNLPSPSLSNPDITSFALILFVIFERCCCNICCFKSSNSWASNIPSPFASYCNIIFCASWNDILHAWANSFADNLPSPLLSNAENWSFALILFVIFCRCCSNIWFLRSWNSCWSNKPSPFASYCIMIFCASCTEILHAWANSFADNLPS